MLIMTPGSHCTRTKEYGLVQMMKGGEGHMIKRFSAEQTTAIIVAICGLLKAVIEVAMLFA